MNTIANFFPHVVICKLYNKRSSDSVSRRAATELRFYTSKFSFGRKGATKGGCDEAEAEAKWEEMKV